MSRDIDSSKLKCKGKSIEQRFSMDMSPGFATLGEEELTEIGRRGVGCYDGCPAAGFCEKRTVVERNKEKGTKRLISVSVTVYPNK